MGRNTYFYRICCVLLDPYTGSILYQCTFPYSSPQSISSSLKSWDLAYFPISGNEPFDRFGQSYNVSLVLLPNDTFNETAYNHYSPLYLPATYAMTYLLAFALSTCALVHTGLYHGQSLINGMKKIKVERDDIHAKLMRNYLEVPEWWYLSTLAFFFCVAVIAVEVCWLLFRPFGSVADCVLYSFVDLAYGSTGLGLVAGRTPSDCLYTAFWIHLCHDGSRCTYTPAFPTCSTHLITSTDKCQCHCANYTRHTSSWQTFCQYDIQSLFGADFIGWYIVYTRSQAGTLCESSTTRNVYRYVKYTFDSKMDTDIVV